MAGKTIARRKTILNTGRKKVVSGRRHVAAEGKSHQNLTVKSQPCGNTQMNRNGLI